MTRTSFAGDNFTKWLLGISATVVVTVGGWLVSALNENTRATSNLNQEIQTVAKRLDAFNYELEQTTIKLEQINSRVVRIETKIEHYHER